jgi:hypothetical protein
MSIRGAGFGSTTLLCIQRNAVTLEPRFVALAISATAKQEAARQKKFHCVKKNRATLSGSFTRNHNIHFANSAWKCTKQQNRSLNFFPATFCSTYAGGDYNMRLHAFPTKSSVECLLAARSVGLAAR